MSYLTDEEMKIANEKYGQDKITLTLVPKITLNLTRKKKKRGPKKHLTEDEAKQRNRENKLKWARKRKEEMARRSFVYRLKKKGYNDDQIKKRLAFFEVTKKAMEMLD